FRERHLEAIHGIFTTCQKLEISSWRSRAAREALVAKSRNSLRTAATASRFVRVPALRQNRRHVGYPNRRMSGASRLCPDLCKTCSSQCSLSGLREDPYHSRFSETHIISCQGRERRSLPRIVCRNTDRLWTPSDGYRSGRAGLFPSRPPGVGHYGSMY